MLATLYVKTTLLSDQWRSKFFFKLLDRHLSSSTLTHYRESILKLKDEYYKPRDLSEDDELENIVDAILKQKAMAMDTGYVADVRKMIFFRSRKYYFQHINLPFRLPSIIIDSKIQSKGMLAWTFWRWIYCDAVIMV